MNDHCISRRSFLVAAGMAGAAAALTACGGAASSAASSVASSAAKSHAGTATVTVSAVSASTYILLSVLRLCQQFDPSRYGKTIQEPIHKPLKHSSAPPAQTLQR